MSNDEAEHRRLITAEESFMIKVLGEPMTMVDFRRGYALELAYEKEQSCWCLRIESTDVREMKQAPTREEDLSRLNQIMSLMSSRRKTAAFPVVIRNINSEGCSVLVLITVVHDVAAKITRLSCFGRYSTVVEDKDLADDTLWPVELTCTVHHLTLSLSLTYRPSEEVFVLKINGIEYNHYEFKAIAFNEVESGRSIKGYMHVNHQSIFDRMMPVPFSGDNMRALVEEVLFDEAVESI